MSAYSLTNRSLAKSATVVCETPARLQAEELVELALSGQSRDDARGRFSNSHFSRHRFSGHKVNV